MASKRNWIAFILYISFFLPVSFSTTLEPSSESSFLTSLSTGSTNNASDIINTSILSQPTSSPSPEAPASVQETSHISEELGTQFFLRTTVLLDHEHVGHDEHPATSLPVNTSSSLDGGTNSTLKPERNSAMDLPVSDKRHPLLHRQQKHTSSEDKLSYAKSYYMKKKIVSNNSRHSADKSVPLSKSNLIIMNETNESREHTWGNESDVSNQTQPADVYNSEMIAVSDISQALDDTHDFRTENDAPQRKKFNPLSQEMLHSAKSHEQESKTDTLSGAMSLYITDTSETNDSTLENSHGIKNESSVTNLFQKNNKVKRNESREASTDMNANKARPNHRINNAHFLSGDHPLLNSSSLDDNATTSRELSAAKSHRSLSHSRKRRSSDQSLSSITEIPRNYETVSLSDASLDATRPADTTSAETSIHRMESEAEDVSGSLSYAADDVTLSVVKNSLSESKENFSSTGYVTTSQSADLTSVDENNSGTMNLSPMLSSLASETKGLSYLVKDSYQSAASSPASTNEGIIATSEISAVENLSGKGISNISGNDSMIISTKALTEKALSAEDTVASAMPLCKDDDEIDVESTSEISIKVFPLCEKREISTAVTNSASSSIRSAFVTPTSDSVESPSNAILSTEAKTSENTSEDSGDSIKISESIQGGLEADDHSKDITVLSSVMTELATHSGIFQDTNSEQINLPGSISDGTQVNNMPSVAVTQVEMEEKETEASDALNTEVHGDLNGLMEIEFTEDDVKQDEPNEGQTITTPSDIIGNIDDYENRSSGAHPTEEKSINGNSNNFPLIKPALNRDLKEAVRNSSSNSFDYVADQSEILPVMANPPSQNISFIPDFTARKEIKIIEDAVATDISVIYPEANISGSSDKSEFNQSNESLATDAITASEGPVATKTQKLIPMLLPRTVLNYTLLNSDGSRSQEANTKSENITNTQTKIAGVGVKTTVSVSLNVTKTNTTTMDNSSKNGSNLALNPVLNLINLTSSSQKLPNDFLKPENATDKNETDSSKTPEGIVLGSLNTISAESFKPPDETSSPLPQPSTTTRRSFSLRKPRLRINGENSESPITRKPFLIKTPPTRSSEIGAPVAIFQKNRTRLGSITSSTTSSTTSRVSWPAFVGQPITWRYGLENFTFEAQTVPTTTEEEVQDTDTQTVSFSTLSDDDTVMYRVPASIVVRKGINCLSAHFQNKHSPEYKSRARLVRKMLRSLFHRTEIAPRVLNIEIESMYCRKSRNITVDYNLFLKRDGTEIQKQELVTIFNNKLENSTFNQWILDSSATAFHDPIKEVIYTPAPPAEDAEPPIPQWAIAVIVIGAASLVFIILFGALTVYGRHHMRRRYNGSRLGDDDVDRAIDSREWDDKMAATYENLAADGIYDIDDGGFDSVKRGPHGHARHSKVSRHDSWKSDWTERPRKSRYPTDF